VNGAAELQLNLQACSGQAAARGRWTEFSAQNLARFLNCPGQALLPGDAAGWRQHISRRARARDPTAMTYHHPSNCNFSFFDRQPVV
jgi:hypothetical protein